MIGSETTLSRASGLTTPSSKHLLGVASCMLYVLAVASSEHRASIRLLMSQPANLPASFQLLAAPYKPTISSTTANLAANTTGAWSP
jgi:hypothetical protein